MSLRITALTDPAPAPGHRRLAWLASRAGTGPVGTAFLDLSTQAGRDHLAELSLDVHPVERRRHVGTQLLDAALTAARDHGRRRLVAHADSGSSGDAFLPARGFRAVLTLEYSRLHLPGVDTTALAAIAEAPHPGYRLISWAGTVPDHLAATFAASRRAMDDMPVQDADLGTATWDVDRVRAVAEAVDRRGDHLHTVAAVDTRSGAVAGFTELVVPGGGAGEGQHYGTAVLPEHRGRGLGRWMKAESVRRARERYPDLIALLTDTADTNTPMRRINTALGYVPTHLTRRYQRDL